MKAEQREQEFALAVNDDTNSFGSDFGFASCFRQTLIFISWIFVLVTFPFSLFFCVRIIPEYKRVVVFRLGRISGREKGPGLFFVIPCIDRARTVDLRIRTFEIPPQDCTTKDAVAVAVEGVVYYHVFNAVLCVTAIEDADHSTRHISSSILRNLVGSMDARDVLLQRDRLKQNIVVQLDEVTVLWGVKLDRVEIKDVRVSRDVRRNISQGVRLTSLSDAGRDDDEDDGNHDNGRDELPQQSPTGSCSKEPVETIADDTVDNHKPSPKMATEQVAITRGNAGSHGAASSSGQRTATANSMRSGQSQRAANQRHLMSLQKHASVSVSNQETPNSAASTQITPLNMNVNLNSHFTSPSAANQMAPLNLGNPLNTIRYFNWLSSQSCASDNQQAPLMWPPFEMCFLPVTINADGQLQPGAATNPPNAGARAGFETDSHSPPYANACEITTRPLVHNDGSPVCGTPNMLGNDDEHEFSRCRPSPPPPPLPPPLPTMQPDFSEVPEEVTGSRPLPYSPIQEDFEAGDRLADAETNNCNSRNDRRNSGRAEQKRLNRPPSSLSITSSSTLSDTAAIVNQNGCDSSVGTVDRAKTKSVPPLGADRMRETPNRSNVTISSTTTARSSSSRSQPHLSSPPLQPPPPPPDNDNGHAHLQLQLQSKLQFQSSTGNSKTGRHNRVPSPPPVLPPKPKSLGNTNTNTNGSNAHELLLCKTSDLQKNAHSVFGHGQQNNNSVQMHGRGQPSQLINANSQIPMSGNIGFVPVSLLTNSNRPLGLSNNLPYAMSSVHMPLEANDTNNNSNLFNNSNNAHEMPGKSRHAGDMRTNNSTYTSVSNHSAVDGVNSSPRTQHQSSIKRSTDALPSQSNSMAKKNNNNNHGNSNYAPTKFQKANTDSRAGALGKQQIQIQASFVSPAANKSSASAAARGNSLSNV